MTHDKKLLLYVDPAWRRSGVHTPLLNPWWGNPYDQSSVFAYQMFDTYSYDVSQYGITEHVEEAEAVLAPYRHNWLLLHDTSLLAECETAARAQNLPLLIDGTGDIEYPVTSPNTYVLRYGGYRFLPEHNSIHIPLTTDDLLERCRAGKLELRPKREGVPVVGFAGWTSLSLKQYVRTLAKEAPIRLRGVFDVRYRACTKGVLWRRRAISILQRSRLVALFLRTRDSFSANPKTATGNMEQLREEMVSTILESDYALDVKGDANNSARLYEILSLGRIPVIVDTERVLPFRDVVDYGSFSLIVDFREITMLPERIAAFHKQLSPERFIEMQKNARAAFVNYFRMDAATRLLVTALRERITASAATRTPCMCATYHDQ